MCGLCGILGADVHWSDAASNPQAFGGREATRRQDRLRRVALVNAVLHHFSVKAQDWQATSYMLTTPTGKSTIVDHLGLLWSEAEKLAGRPCDPLDEQLLSALEQQSSYKSPADGNV
ncbi:MAG: hypothetical protein ACTSWM_06520 [Alphaproteobacteria bacterium]